MIELRNVGVTYPSGEVTALRDITLCIPRGDFVFLVGATGAGKSTLLKLLYSDVRPTCGSLRIHEREITDLSSREVPALRRQMGIILQDYGLLPQRTVWENIAFACHVLGLPRRDIRPRIVEVLNLVGMGHRSDAFPSELSGGEQQRVAIARALVSDPLILIADEPTGNLDPETSAGIMQLLLEANGRGATVVVATHDKSMVDRLRRRVVALERGEIIRDEREGVYGYEA